MALYFLIYVVNKTKTLIIFQNLTPHVDMQYCVSYIVQFRTKDFQLLALHSVSLILSFFFTQN